MIAFLGTGLMGTGFVQRLLALGEEVTVWNRTLGKAEALAANGARVAPDPAAAVREASRVHLSLLDDAAVDDVLAQALPALRPGAPVVDHTTTAPDPTAERMRRLEGERVRYLHAPVFMGPGNARDGTGLMLAAGPEPLFQEVCPMLERMTGTLKYVGDHPGRAAALKLFGNMMIMFIVTGTADVLRLARALDIAPGTALGLFDTFNPCGQIQGRGQRMAAGDLTPFFELSAARKDVRLMLESAARHGTDLAVLPAIASLFDRYIQAGYGRDDLAVVGTESPT